MPDDKLPSEDTIAAIQESIARIEGEVTVLKIASTKVERPWLQNPSIIISVLALLFSFGTTIVSYLRSHQQDIIASRAELRTLIQRLDQIPVENVQYYKIYADDPGALDQLSGLLNSENALVAKQAADVIYRIPDNVGATEYSAVANALVQSALTEKAMKLFEGGLKVSNDANDESNLLRAYAATLFSVGDAEGGRAQYKTALALFEKYRTMNNFYAESTHLLTEMSWADAENSIRQCNYAKTHLNQAESHLSAVSQAPGPLTDQLKANFNKLRERISVCTP
jgi:tetratricopeptide (TPR) repeat protein